MHWYSGFVIKTWEALVYVVSPILLLLVFSVERFRIYSTFVVIGLVLIYVYTIISATRKGRYIGYHLYSDDGLQRETFYGIATKMERYTQKFNDIIGKQKCPQCGSELRYLHLVENDVKTLVGLHTIDSSVVRCRDNECDFVLRGERDSLV